MILATIILMSLVWDFLSRLRQETIVLEHQFRLYALRDALREQVMQGSVKSDNWVFQYLDSSIAKLISQLSTVSFWRVLSMMLFYPRNPRTKVGLEHLAREMKKPHNAPLLKIYIHYMAELGFFLTKRHSVLRYALLSFGQLIRAQSWTREKYRQAKALLTAAPETSTLAEFCS